MDFKVNIGSLVIIIYDIGSKDGNDVVEDHMTQCKFNKGNDSIESNDKLSILASSAASIKRTTMNIKNMMVDDESLLTDIDKGMVKNQNVLKQTMGRIDQMINKASGNVLCYTLLFFFMILALLYKLTK